MVLDSAGTIFVRLCFSGPLLYIGLLMVIDPASFVTSLQTLACVLRTFEHRFHGFQWQERLSEPDSVQVSPGARKAVRFAGLALAAIALLGVFAPLR